MKAEELRIGNLIYHKGSVVKVITVGRFGIHAESDKSTISAKFHTPDLKDIPLTEEWLLKFGFNVGISDSQFLISVTKDCLMSVFLFRSEDNWFIGDDIEVTVKHVHQLQNLYFALTGTELTLNQ